MEQHDGSRQIALTDMPTQLKRNETKRNGIEIEIEMAGGTRHGSRSGEAVRFGAEGLRTPAGGDAGGPGKIYGVT